MLCSELSTRPATRLEQHGGLVVVPYDDAGVIRGGGQQGPICFRIRVNVSMFHRNTCKMVGPPAAIETTVPGGQRRRLRGQHRASEGGAVWNTKPRTRGAEGQAPHDVTAVDGVFARLVAFWDPLAFAVVLKGQAPRAEGIGGLATVAC
ncbi:hypothetical protein EYF80_009007 [Liparis tanakae]|uniref:Uncharacterized protein n=1 Tax=Liparis tanakae TaxID=230148 RepID=A0A4Z2IU85_9TELE|nr:hypothetical protein EYF80_009007 [Liparis tanakae]